MLNILKRLNSSCWGDHEWIYRTGERGMWLECRHCGRATHGFELPQPQYRRTQDPIPSAHRLGKEPTTRMPAAAQAVAPSQAPSVVRSLTALQGKGASVQSAAPTSFWVAPIARTDAERRWLQTWRALSPDEREAAEQMLTRLRSRDSEPGVAHAS